MDLMLISIFLTPTLSPSFVQIFIRMSCAEGSTEILLRQSEQKTEVKYVYSDR